MSAEVSEERVQEALERHAEVVGCYDPATQPDRPPVREATATALRDAIDLCQSRGRSRSWALHRIARAAGVQPCTVDKWTRRGVPPGQRRDALWEGAAAAVHEAGMRYRLGDRLRRTRERLGLRQDELARKVGVTPQTYGAWEREESQPCAENLERLEDVLRRLLRARG